MIPNYEQLDLERISSGWAPCAHDAEERERLEREYFPALGLDDTGVEALLWRLGYLSTAPVACSSEMWVRVIVDGVIITAPGGGKQYRFRTVVEADTFRLALAESVKRWQDKHTELGVDPDE